MLDIDESVRSVELPQDIGWLEDNDILGRDLQTPHICGPYVAYLYAADPKREGRLWVHPVVFGLGHNQGRGGIQKRVKTHIAIFQVEIEKGKAMHVGHGESLDWRKKL